MAQRVSTGERQGYATALAGLWGELARTLRRLDELAADPEETLAGDAAADELSRLQYALHVAGERVWGLEPPAGAEQAHRELAAALAGARDATAEVAEATEVAGPEAAAFIVHEWRGALFRVRLARLRMTAPRRLPAAAGGERPRRVAAPLVAFALTVCGASAFALGATLSAWPLWAAGMLAVVGGLLAYRP
ncbi:MAG TPA: hypothetical protein VLN26_08695 [Gaiellaceae bacterium]|nr:hypothetical protein [Gaiellaceae bacterium]